MKRGSGLRLEAKGLWFRYPGQRDWLLRGADASLQGGELVAVVGPNGAGKTTLLKLLAGLYRPQQGCICIDDVNIWSVDPKTRLEARRRIVYVHEEPIMLRGSVLDNAAAGLLIRGVPRGEALRKARASLEKLGIAHLADRRPRELSRGQRQLAALARAYALGPEGLLLDEPFAHLDRQGRRRLLALLEELRNQGVAVAVATHSPLLVRRLATRVLIVEDGRVEEAEPEKLDSLLA